MGVGGRDGITLSCRPAQAGMDSRQRRPPECGAWLYFRSGAGLKYGPAQEMQDRKARAGRGRPVTYPPEGKNCTFNPFDAPGIVP